MRYLLAVSAVVAGLVSGAASATAASPAIVPVLGEHLYDILRDGARIGTQISSYSQDGNRLTVLTRMDIEVSMLFVTAYKFQMESLEEWVDGRFVAMKTRADDDGKRKAVDLHADGDRGVLNISYNGKTRTADAGTLPASLWNPATVEQAALVDVLNGKTHDVRVRPLGSETITIGGQPVEARHYAMEGDLERELWYGADGQLLKVVFAGPDGSQISIVKRAP